MLGKLELADDRSQERDDVELAESEAREDLLGHRRAAQHVTAFEHEDGASGAGRYAAAVRPLWPPPMMTASYRFATGVIVGRGARRTNRPLTVGQPRPGDAARLRPVRDHRGGSPLSVGTAFHPRTSALNSTMAWGEWSGYFAAAVYADSHDIEYNAIREQAGLIDVTPLYKYEITGPDAARLVDRVVTRDVSKLAVDRVDLRRGATRTARWSTTGPSPAGESRSSSGRPTPATAGSR